MRTTLSCALILLLAACGGDGPSLPGAVAVNPTTPPTTPPGAADLIAVSPTSFTGVPGGVVVLQVRALRADGGPASGVPVVFKSQAGGGSIQPVVTTSDGQGFASVNWTLGPLAAVNLATATALLAPSPVSFTVSTVPAS